MTVINMQPLEISYIEKEKIYKLLAFGATDTYVDLLIRVLRGGNLTIREELEKSLHGFGDGELMRLLLKKLEVVSSDVAFWLSRLIISTESLKPEMVIAELSGASSDKLIWLTKIMGELKRNEFVVPLVGLLKNDNKNVKYEVTKVLARYSGDAISDGLLDYYLNESEEERIAIIENFRTISKDKLVERLVDKLEEVNEKDAYWIAKLLTETSEEKLEVFKKIEKSTSRSTKKYYWVKRIVEHIEGKSYL
jgi:hypothetical protein